MARNLKNLFDELKNMRLPQDAKLKIRQNLAAFTAAHPVRKTEEPRHMSRKWSSFSWILFLKERKLIMPAVIIALIIALTGTVSVAAQGALPGDALYPVKININEKVRAAFALSVEANGTVEAGFAEARIVEAERLAAQNRLNAATRAELEQRFDAHIQRVEEKIAELEAAGRAEAAAGLSSGLEAFLMAHERILLNLEAQAETQAESRAEVRSILENVRVKAREATRIRIGAEADVSAQADVQVKTAAEGKMQAAQNKLAEVESFIMRHKARLSAEASAQAEAKLAEAKAIFAEGQAKLEAEANGEAFALFQQTIRTAQEAKLMAEAGFRFDLNLQIEVGGNGALETGAEAESEAESETEVEIDVQRGGGAEVDLDVNAGSGVQIGP